MNKNNKTDVNGKPGDRLNTILDFAGLKKGRGRIRLFHRYLLDNFKGAEGLDGIPYSTVQSWFNDVAPPFSKVNPVVDKLHEHAEFSVDTDQIKLWWKMNGESPFEQHNLSKEKQLKVDIEINYYIREFCGEDFDNIDADKLALVVEKAHSEALDYANPKVTDIPRQLMKLLVQDEIKKIID